MPVGILEAIFKTAITATKFKTSIQIYIAISLFLP